MEALVLLQTVHDVTAFRSFERHLVKTLVVAIIRTVEVPEIVVAAISSSYFNSS